MQQHVEHVHLAAHEWVDLAVVGESAGRVERLRVAAAEPDVGRAEQPVTRGDRVRLEALVLPGDRVAGQDRHLVRAEGAGLDSDVGSVGVGRGRHQEEERRHNSRPDHRLTR